MPERRQGYAKQSYSYPKKRLDAFKGESGDAFDFGEVQVYPLTINAAHGQEAGEDKVFRYVDPGEDNKDSIVLKIQFGEASAILTGDATSVVTNRVLHNYEAPALRAFLRASLLLASHHGSYTYGSNNKAWIQATAAEYIFISSGHFQNHPHIKAYKRFKQSPNLKKVGKKPHPVLVFNPDSKNKKKLVDRNRLTRRAIFSTLSWGTLTAELMPKGKVKITTENEGRLKTKKSRKIEESEEEVIPPVPFKVRAEDSDSFPLSLFEEGSGPGEVEEEEDRSTPIFEKKHKQQVKQKSTCSTPIKEIQGQKRKRLTPHSLKEQQKKLKNAEEASRDKSVLNKEPKRKRRLKDKKELPQQSTPSKGSGT